MCLRGELAAQAQVAHLEPLRGDEHVGRLEVAMHDALAVHVAQRGRELREEPPHVPLQKQKARRPLLLDQLPKVAARVLQHQHLKFTQRALTVTQRALIASNWAQFRPKYLQAPRWTHIVHRPPLAPTWGFRSDTLTF